MNRSAIQRATPAWRRAACRVPGALSVALGLLLAGCTTAKPIVVSNHPHAYAIDCSGASLSWSHCYQKAGRACPQGYGVAQKPYKHDERIAAGDFLQLLGNSAQHRRMLIECKDPGNHPPAAEPPAHAGDDNEIDPPPLQR